MEKFFLKSLLFLSLVISLAACAPVNSVDAPVGLDAYTPVVDMFSEKDQHRLVGSGTVRFSSPLIGPDMAFNLRGSLDTLSGSFLAVVFYADALHVTNDSGIEVRFTRVNAQVQGEIRVRHASSSMAPERLAFFFPSELDVIIQVQSTSAGSRVLIWRRSLVSYTLLNADVDSNLHVTPTLPTFGGLGLYLGLTMNFATVEAAQVTSPIVPLL